MANADDTWGAHTKVVANFTNAHFENVEYYQVRERQCGREGRRTERVARAEN